MKKLYLIIIFLLCVQLLAISQERTLPEVMPDSTTISLARMLGKDIFELNGVPYLQPTVEAMNATSNARFFHQSFVPSRVNKPYFRIGIHGMYGVVPNSKKTYSPQLPNKELTAEELGKFASVDILNQTFTIKDTAGLIFAALKGMLYDGIRNGSIKVPTSAPTSLGSGRVSFDLPSDTLQKLFENLSVSGLKIYPYLPPEIKDSLSKIFDSFPQFFNLPEGANINYLTAMVPQVEIGALYGTELLLRLIPSVNMGKDIGKFAFWGVGLKHSISQYFNEGDEPDQRYFDMAIQVVYQGTTLKNSIGVTNADLTAKATMWDFNLQASKHFEGILDIYTGLSYDMIDITSDYVYYLPIEMQWELGLIDKYSYENPNFDPTQGHPGDQNPQKATISLNDTNIKWVIGVSRQIGPVGIFLDFNMGKFNIFSGGVEYRF